MCELSWPGQSAFQSAAAACIDRARHTPDASCWSFGAVEGLLKDAKARVWLWRIGDHPGQLAMSYRPTATMKDLREWYSDRKGPHRNCEDLLDLMQGE